MTISRWDALAALGASVALAALYFIAWPLPILAVGVALAALGIRKA